MCGARTHARGHAQCLWDSLLPPISSWVSVRTPFTSLTPECPLFLAFLPHLLPLTSTISCLSSTLKGNTVRKRSLEFYPPQSGVTSILVCQGTPGLRPPILFIFSGAPITSTGLHMGQHATRSPHVYWTKAYSPILTLLVLPSPPPRENQKPSCCICTPVLCKWQNQFFYKITAGYLWTLTLIWCHLNTHTQYQVVCILITFLEFKDTDSCWSSKNAHLHLHFKKKKKIAILGKRYKMSSNDLWVFTQN